jgi:hypothetical protein
MTDIQGFNELDIRHPRGILTWLTQPAPRPTAPPPVRLATARGRTGLPVVAAGFWKGAAEQRKAGVNLGDLAPVAPKKGDFPVLTRQPFPADGELGRVARERNERMLTQNEGTPDAVPGVLAVLQQAAEAGIDVAALPEYAVWLGRTVDIAVQQ